MSEISIHVRPLTNPSNLHVPGGTNHDGISLLCIVLEFNLQTISADKTTATSKDWEVAHENLQASIS